MPLHQWHLASAKVTSGAKTGTIKSFPGDQIVIAGDDGNALACTGSLNHAGNAFSLTWKKSY